MSSATKQFRRTKIVATLGPASSSPEVMRQLIEAGVDVFRLNFSHGNYEEKASQISTARAEAAEAGRCVTLLQDLQGPKIRVGQIRDEPVFLQEGSHIELYSDGREGDAHQLTVSYEHLADEVNPGDSIFLDDGSMELLVEDVYRGVVHASVVRGGQLSSRKGVNLPGAKLSAPSLTAKDREDLRFGLDAGIDVVALSFVRKPEDAETARRIIERSGRSAPLIAKIEKREALDSIGGVLEAFDGVMVARGDLGVELGPEKVPLAQKQIIRRANAVGKPVITATQMLESMTYSKTPTRAEASDVANAVLDGTDAVMLSGETAIGMFPVEAVTTMDRIVREAEHNWNPEPSQRPVSDSTAAFCSAAVKLAIDIDAAAIAALTRDGGTARILSSLRPPMPIFALSQDDSLARRLNVWRNVRPLTISPSHAIQEASEIIKAELTLNGLLPPESQVVIVGVAPESVEVRTDFIRLITL